MSERFRQSELLHAHVAELNRWKEFPRRVLNRKVRPATETRAQELKASIVRTVNDAGENGLHTHNGFSRFVNDMAELLGGLKSRDEYGRPRWTTGEVQLPELEGTVKFRAQKEHVGPYKNEIEIRIPRGDHDSVLVIDATKMPLNPPELRRSDDLVDDSGPFFYTTLYQTKTGKDIFIIQKPVDIKEDEWCAGIAEAILGVKRVLLGPRLVDSKLNLPEIKEAIKALSQGVREWPKYEPDGETSEWTRTKIKDAVIVLAQKHWDKNREPFDIYHLIEGRLDGRDVNIFVPLKRKDGKVEIDFEYYPVRLDFMGPDNKFRKDTFYIQQEPNGTVNVREEIIEDPVNIRLFIGASLPKTKPVSEETASGLLEDLKNVVVTPLAQFTPPTK